MCIILIAEDKKPTLKMLKKMEDSNRDGAGMAWRDKKTGCVHWVKGLDSKGIYKQIQKVNLPFVVHFRIATAGGVSKNLCHPFPVCDSVPCYERGHMMNKRDSVLFQNGHWYSWDVSFKQLNKYYPLPDGEYSDTRLVAYMIAKFGPKAFDKIHLGKWVLFSGTKLELFGGAWEEYEGFKVSNTFFAWDPVNYGYSYKYDDDNWYGANDNYSLPCQFVKNCPTHSKEGCVKDLCTSYFPTNVERPAWAGCYWHKDCLRDWNAGDLHTSCKECKDYVHESKFRGGDLV